MYVCQIIFIDNALANLGQLSKDFCDVKKN